MALSIAPLQQLQTLLEGLGLSASQNPEDINLPGAWLTIEGIRPVALDGTLELQSVVYLIAGDRDYVRAWEALSDLYNTVTTVLQPDGLVVPQGVILPGNPTPMPALRVPVNLT